MLGEPGAGKTILCSQFLLNGYLKYGENGIFVSMDEGKAHYMREMKTFGWDFASAEKEGKFAFVDCVANMRNPRRSKSGEPDDRKAGFFVNQLTRSSQEYCEENTCESHCG